MPRTSPLASIASKDTTRPQGTVSADSKSWPQGSSLPFFWPPRVHKSAQPLIQPQLKMADSLQKLYEELGNPSQAKLLQAAKKRGIKATAAQVKEIAGKDPTRQVFAKPLCEVSATKALPVASGTIRLKHCLLSWQRSANVMLQSKQ